MTQNQSGNRIQTENKTWKTADEEGTEQRKYILSTNCYNNKIFENWILTLPGKGPFEFGKAHLGQPDSIGLSCVPGCCPYNNI